MGTEVTPLHDSILVIILRITNVEHILPGQARLKKELAACGVIVSDADLDRVLKELDAQRHVIPHLVYDISPSGAKIATDRFWRIITKE